MNAKKIAERLRRNEPDIIATEPLAEVGTAEWALQMMKLGNKVRNRDWDGGTYEKSLLYCQLIGETIKYNEGCSAFDVCLSDWEAPYIKNTGWQLYEEPQPTYKVGDWVDCKDFVGVPAQCKVLEIQEHNVIVECKTGHIWSLPHNNITRKLSPSEVVVNIGCLSGTVKDLSYVEDGRFWFIGKKTERCPGGMHAILYGEMLDTPTRELVESLLKAQEEK